jgi:hypothetical protein
LKDGGFASCPGSCEFNKILAPSPGGQSAGRVVCVMRQPDRLSRLTAQQYTVVA